MSLEQNPKAAGIASVVLAVIGLASRITYPAFEGALVYVRPLVAFLLVAAIGAAYVSRNRRADVSDGIKVAGIASLVAVPILTLLEVAGGVVLWNQPVSSRLSIGVVLVIVVLNTIALTVVPITAMFALGTARSLRESASIVGLLVAVCCLAVLPLIVGSGFGLAEMTNVTVTVTTAILLGTPLFVFARFVESDELQLHHAGQT
ncbi:hypothetical protein [Halorussus lipolyticus]|uniref:hypothetical protein n=1 Tax=Halorussus lipolyticus TaxID=3034024 RepID=UPI0023E8D640|nr:hypothetical protein [Halorussus sp. DT80]